MLNNNINLNKEENIANINQHISEKSLEEEINILQSKLGSIKKPKKNSNLVLLILILIATILLSSIYYLYSYPSVAVNLISNLVNLGVNKKTSNSINIINTPQPMDDIQRILTEQEKHTLHLQSVNNVGYKFYLGKIDYPNSPPITDEVKNAITQVIYKSNVPKSLLNNSGIVLVNTLAKDNVTWVEHQGEISNVPEFDPSFLTGGAVYATYQKSGPLIFINLFKLCSSSNTQPTYIHNQTTNNQSCRVDNNFLTNSLTHELAHHVSQQMTDEEWKTYYQLRKIPVNTSRSEKDWQISPIEDFAMVYNYIFTGNKVRTVYGEVSQETKDFVKSIVNRLN